MKPVTEDILAALLKVGIYIAGQSDSTSYVEYSYSINAELKQIIIKIDAAKINIFSGESEFAKTFARKRHLDYLLGDLTLELAKVGLMADVHYTINNDNYTIPINYEGYNKLLKKDKFKDLLNGVTTIYSLTSPNLHEVAETISKIMDNKNPCFRIMPNNDRSAHELYADGGLSENLAQQLRDSFRTAALTVLNQPDVMPMTDKDLPVCEQAESNTKVQAIFKKYISISQHLYKLLIKVLPTIKAEPAKKTEDLLQGQKKSTRRIKFDGETEVEAISHDSELQGTELVTLDEKDKKKKLDVKKRQSFAASAQRLSKMVNSNPDGIEWSVLVTSGLAADMEDILPEGREITLENKYLICKQLETFFLNPEKIKSFKMINFLFVSLLEFKDYINIHKHETSDYFLFKKNTDSWQKLIKCIRNRAFELLEEEVSKIKDDFEAIKMLREQRNKDIFKLHRANAFFLKIGRTSTVKKIMHL